MGEPLTALPNTWVARLFSRFQAIYGNKAALMWGDADMAEVRSVWADELGRYDGADIKVALEATRFSHQEYPPTLYEFAALCRDAMRARTQTARALTYPRYGAPPPELLAELHELAKPPDKRKAHPHDWARRLVQRDLAGESVHAYSLQCAREVLGIVDRAAP